MKGNGLIIKWTDLNKNEIKNEITLWLMGIYYNSTKNN
jgi:hypothetical protein